MPPPQAALDFLREHDGAPEYEAYYPGPVEIMQTAALMEKMPLKKMLKERLLGLNAFERKIRLMADLEKRPDAQSRTETRRTAFPTHP